MLNRVLITIVLWLVRPGVKKISIQNKTNWAQPTNTFDAEGGHFVILGSCAETLILHKNGSYDLSNIYRESISGSWKMDGDELELYDADTLGKILDRVYEIELDHDRRVLKSSDTKITLDSEGYGIFQ